MEWLSAFKKLPPQSTIIAILHMKELKLREMLAFAKTATY